MSEHVYKIIRLSGSSTLGYDDAVRTAVERAGKTLHNLRWFEVKEMRGEIKDGVVGRFQVVLEVGFTLDDATAGD
jgi:flavin-binding protein dodecin